MNASPTAESLNAYDSYSMGIITQTCVSEILMYCHGIIITVAQTLYIVKALSSLYTYHVLQVCVYSLNSYICRVIGVSQNALLLMYTFHFNF